MFVSQVVSDTAVLVTRRADGPFGPAREEARATGMRARVADSWRRLTARTTPQQVVCADCSA